MHEGGSGRPKLTGDTIVEAMRAVLKGPTTPRSGFELLRYLHGSESECVRREALSFLGDDRTTADRAVPLLVDALGDVKGRFSVAYTAARSLERMGPAAKKALPALISIANERKVGNLNQQALIALGAIDPQGEKVLPVLIEALKSNDHYARIGAAHALRKMTAPGDRIVPPLIQALESSTSRASRHFLIRALAKYSVHAKAALPVLRRLAENKDVPRDDKGNVVWDVEEAARNAIRDIERSDE